MVMCSMHACGLCVSQRVLCTRFSLSAEFKCIAEAWPVLRCFLSAATFPYQLPPTEWSATDRPARNQYICTWTPTDHDIQRRSLLYVKCSRSSVWPIFPSLPVGPPLCSRIVLSKRFNIDLHVRGLVHQNTSDVDLHFCLSTLVVSGSCGVGGHSCMSVKNNVSVIVYLLQRPPNPVGRSWPIYRVVSCLLCGQCINFRLWFNLLPVAVQNNDESLYGA